MKALTWHGKRDVRVEQVPDPGIREPDDVIIRVTSSGVCERFQKKEQGTVKVVITP